MKQLQKQFEGRGEVKGYSFNQLFATDKAYIYALSDENGISHYEVFKHVENTQFNCISYPRSNSFGIWAWCTKSIERAMDKFNQLNDHETTN